MQINPSSGLLTHISSTPVTVTAAGLQIIH
jgi:hypothetical protein